MHPVEKRFDVGGLEIVGKAWHKPDLLPVIALHGWLDNCASFDVLAPQLKNCHVLALDLAGHGYSGHRAGLAPYHIYEDVAEVMAVADQLGWHEFGLLGHSRGGMIATLAAASFPQRVKWLGLIDGLLPDPFDPKEAPAQLAKSIRSMSKQLSKNTVVYPSVEAAISARINGGFGLSENAAELITRRGIKACEGGYCWRTDQKLRAALAIRLTAEQIVAVLQNISVPNTLITADKGMPNWFKTLMEMLPEFPAINRVALSGSHHLHMESESSDVAQLFSQQLAELNATHLSAQEMV